MQKDTSSTVTNTNYANNAQATTLPSRAERNRQRFGGRSFQYGHRNQPVFFGPFAEFSSPPPAVFDIPPRILPANMFNANVVPPSERDAQFEMQFAPFMNHSSPHYFDNNLPCFYENDDEIVDIQEGYGCPPSYIMESYRDQTDLIVAAGNCRTFKDNSNSEITISPNIFQNDRDMAYHEHDSLQTLRGQFVVEAYASFKKYNIFHNRKRYIRIKQVHPFGIRQLCFGFVIQQER
ncbi:hypothetical protein X798_01480 [Onchocerca flexuosa]|uniref:Uncharacterized protein n=1 Tax=Onchocerca flexuosa TaxID=387005 RepID=A0A238C2D5_9BILA|nr:hypothetical protein X798_01480 [Onchocerca flexuosa]